MGFVFLSFQVLVCVTDQEGPIHRSVNM